MDRQLKCALWVFSIGVFAAALDNGIITSSLTTLIHSFHVSPTWGAWTITVYTLGLAISVPIVGNLSDRYGRRKLFIIEVSLFGLGSLLVALSPNFTVFLLSRFLQSMGGGGIFILASSFIVNSFPRDRQGRALGMLGAMNGIAAILGPNVGAFILQFTGNWQWLFFINVPIVVGLAIAGAKFICEKQKLVDSKLDSAGIFLLSFAILSFMYGFTTLDGVDFWGSVASPTFLAYIGAGAALLIALSVVERRAASRGIEPVLPVQLLKSATFRLTLVIAMFSGAILASVIFIPGYVEQYLDVPRSLSGYWFTPLAIASGVGASRGGALVDRRGPIFTLTVASLIAITGYILFPLWVVTKWQMVIASCFVGAGFGMMLGAPVNVLATENSGDRKGMALATTSLFRQVGMTLAPTIYAGFLARSLMQMGEKMQTGLAAANLPAPQLAKLNDVTSVKTALEQVPDPTVRKMLLDILHQVVGHGYNGLYITAMIISVLVLIIVTVLAVIRKNQIHASKLSARR